MSGNQIHYPLGADVGVNYSTNCCPSCGVPGGGGNGSPVGGHSFNEFNEISSVVSGSMPVITQFAVPVSNNVILQRVLFAGTNIASYYMYFDANKKASAWTWFNGPMFGSWEFSIGNGGGVVVLGGTVIKVFVTHNRPGLGTFSANIIGLII